MHPKTRILFVCHGNICRSPMAEYVMKDLVAKAGLEDFFEIASAATSTEEIGEDVYPPVRRVLAEKGIPAPPRKARQIRRSDAEYYDMLIAMDSRNLRNMRLALGDDATPKIHKLMEFAGSTEDVADPWYSRDFRGCYEDVVAGCTGLLSHLGW